jgi:acetyl esterase
VAKEYWYVLGGMLLLIIGLVLTVADKNIKRPVKNADATFSYKEVDGQQLMLHVFSPPEREVKEPLPAMLLFHGGRWLFGEPRAFYRHCAFFAAQGYVCISAQYRLGSNNTVDVRQLVDDAADALSYLTTHAQQLNIDPDKIIAGGGSSGGHLAAALGVLVPQLAQREYPIRPAGLVLYNPMLDLSPGTPDYPLVTDYWQAVSPQHHIDDSVPPTIVLVGSEDPEVPIPTARAFCDAVTGKGGRCELEIYQGQTHGFFNEEPYLAKTNSKVLEFLQSL